jgi:hypothetical protein
MTRVLKTSVAEDYKKTDPARAQRVLDWTPEDGQIVSSLDDGDDYDSKEDTDMRLTGSPGVYMNTHYDRGQESIDVLKYALEYLDKKYPISQYTLVEPTNTEAWDGTVVKNDPLRLSRYYR